jgi:hypothetical protein
VQDLPLPRIIEKIQIPIREGGNASNRRSERKQLPIRESVREKEGKK